MNEKHRVQMNLPCTMRYLNMGTELVTAMLKRLPSPPDEETIASIQLAVQELCANIVEHANDDESKRFQLNLALTNNDTQLIVETFDSGSAFDPEQIAVPAFGVEQIGGFGLFLIKKAMDEVYYFARSGKGWEGNEDEWKAFDHTASDKNRWKLIKYLA